MNLGQRVFRFFCVWHRRVVIYAACLVVELKRHAGMLAWRWRHVGGEPRSAGLQNVLSIECVLYRRREGKEARHIWGGALELFPRVFSSFFSRD
jgi:hypothetical protein